MYIYISKSLVCQFSPSLFLTFPLIGYFAYHNQVSIDYKVFQRLLRLHNTTKCINQLMNK